MSKAKLDAALIAALKLVPPDQAGERIELRAALGCTPGELKDAITRLRFKGIIEFSRIALKPSMRAPVEPSRETPPQIAPAQPLPEGGGAESDAAAGGGGSEAVAPKRLERATAHAPEAAAAQPGSPTGAEPTGAEGVKRALPPPLCVRPTGLELAAEIRVYLAHVGGYAHEFSLAAVGYPNLLANLDRSTGSPRQSTIDKVRTFMAANPDGFAGMIEAAPARAGRYRPPERALSTVELIQSALAETPQDLIRAVTRKHPLLWRRAIALGRRHGTTPAAALYSALEAGLSHVERETAHGSA